MKLRVGASSDVGRSRERNEDSYLASHPLYVVADGMGGHRGGAVASSMAVEVLSGMPQRDPAGLPERVREANRAVFERQASDRAVAGMGTTVTAAVLDGSTLHLAHVGDSRAYLLRDGELRQLTEDHTLVHRMVQEGKISEEEAHTHPQRSILTRALGVDRDVEVDELTVDVQEGDHVLLCSDGLTGMMRDESVREILEGHRDPQEAAEMLVDAANRAGGLDNITVVVMALEPGDGVETLAQTSGGAFATAGTTPAPSTAETPRPDVTAAIPRVAPGEAEGHPPRRRRRALLWVGIALVLVIGGLTAFGLYINGQWYVGQQNGHVTIFRGIPSTVVGIDLSRSVRETGIAAGDVRRLAPYRDLDSGITVDSESDANHVIDSICRDLIAQQNSQKGPQKPQKPPGCT
ncbi:MAG: Stp1/IreP family PP2C-type Ser/Thr phosphatase [Actinomycetota bacterium]|nr:Stp1/IreP family PP2C-type Ser/Thr phosphatase [Actinomycetota bacterium]